MAFRIPKDGGQFVFLIKQTLHNFSLSLNYSQASFSNIQQFR
jgi:hypothetical protein